MDDTDGWPDKICIQCIHQVSRCHAFKARVEKSDQQLRQYIKGITVIVEEPITQIELQRPEPQQHNARIETQTHHHIQAPQRQEIQITRADIPNHHTNEVHAPQQMIITNGQLHNAQIINAGQIVTNAQGHQLIHTGTANTPNGQSVQLCQLVQTANGTVQLMQQNGQPAQVVQIQRTTDDRCEIIVQPDMQGETQYYTEDDIKTLVTVTTQAIHQDDIQEEEVQMIEEIEEIEEVEEVEEIEEIEAEPEEEQIMEQDQEQEQEQEAEEDEQVFQLNLTDDSECEDKEYLGRIYFINLLFPFLI